MILREKLGTVSIVLVGVLYVALRFWHLADSCLWFDEIFSVHAAGMNFQNLVWFVAQDLIHPPLFYILLKFWISAGGESLFWLRLFPVVFAILSIVPLMLLCRELKLNAATIALVFFLLAVNGSLIKYAQEVRMYSVVMFFALFSMWLFTRFFYLGKNIWILTLVNVLLIYTHYFGWLVVLSELAVIVILQRIKIRQTLIMFGILLLGFVPWIFAVVKAAEINANLGQNIGWIQRPGLSTLFQFLFDLIEPFYFQQSSIDPTSIFLITIPLLLFIITAFVIYFVDWKSVEETEKKNLWLLVILLKLPILLAFIGSWIFPYSVWGTRHLIFAFVPFTILTATALTKIKVVPIAAGLTCLIILLAGAELMIQANRPPTVFIWCAWEDLAGRLDKTKPATIYVFEDLVAYDMWFALRAAAPDFRIVKVEGIDGIQEDPAYFLPRGFDQIQKTDENGMTGERFFVAYRDSVFHEKHPPLQNLVKKGYHIGEPLVYETPGLRGFLVEVSK